MKFFNVVDVTRSTLPAQCRKRSKCLLQRRMTLPVRLQARLTRRRHGLGAKPEISYGNQAIVGIQQWNAGTHPGRYTGSLQQFFQGLMMGLARPPQTLAAASVTHLQLALTDTGL